MNRHDLIKLVENDMTFVLMLKKGMIPLTILDRKCYYERFIEELKTNKKTQAITNASEEFNVSERTIYNAIEFMEG